MEKHQLYAYMNLDNLGKKKAQQLVMRDSHFPCNRKNGLNRPNFDIECPLCITDRTVGPVLGVSIGHQENSIGSHNFETIENAIGRRNIHYTA